MFSMIFDRLSRVVPTNHAGRYRLPNNAIRPPSSNAPLDANDATNVAGVPDPTRVFDVESNLIEFTSESFDIGLGEVRKLFDIGDGHRGPPCA